jgi:hypothetical protein
MNGPSTLCTLRAVTLEKSQLMVISRYDPRGSSALRYDSVDPADTAELCVYTRFRTSQPFQSTRADPVKTSPCALTTRPTRSRHLDG